MDYSSELVELEQYCRKNGVEMQRDVPLGGRCSFRVGGRADVFLEPSSEEQLSGLLPFLSEKGIPGIVLGRGSNVLFHDAGIRGAVICLGDKFSDMELRDETTIFCQSGRLLIQLCKFAWENGLSGLEFAYGIPGSVGGAVYMNAGAYGGEMKDVLLSARHIRPDGSVGEFAGEELKLSYRKSAYSDTGLIITGAVFKLRPGNRDGIWARMEDYMERRRSKQPLEYPSAGSTFKRPEGGYASELIDRCGLKGRTVGGAQVSEKHAGFVINRGGATCADILELMRVIQHEVKEKTGFDLQPEIKIYQ